MITVELANCTIMELSHKGRFIVNMAWKSTLECKKYHIPSPSSILLSRLRSDDYGINTKIACGKCIPHYRQRKDQALGSSRKRKSDKLFISRIISLSCHLAGSIWETNIERGHYRSNANELWYRRLVHPSKTVMKEANRSTRYGLHDTDKEQWKKYPMIHTNKAGQSEVKRKLNRKISWHYNPKKV